MRLRPDGQVSEQVAEYWIAVGVPTQVNAITRETFQQVVNAGQIEASVWFADVVSEKDMYTRPIWFRPPCGLDPNPVGGGLDWRKWELTGGAEGTEPPAKFKAQQDLVRRWQSTPLGSDA